MKDAGAHGGQIYQVAERLGRPVETLLDFSASLNPLGPPPSVLQTMHEAVNGCQHYPDSSSEDLRARLAHEHQISQQSILVANGSVELIRFLPRALGLRYACIVGPTFSEFEHSLQLAGVRWTAVNADSAQRYSLPREKLQEVLEEWELAYRKKCGKPSRLNRAVFVCNPNSPTGQRISLRHMRKLVRQVHQIGSWIIVDEAFMDWCPSHSLIKDISVYSRLLILRSFTKFFSIPGIRLGYLVGQQAVVESIQKHLPPWSVNHVAQAAGMTALSQVSFRKKSLSFMEQERPRFLGELRAIPGLRVLPTDTNFVMVEIVDCRRSEEIVARLLDQGILVRDCQNFSGMSVPALRFAIRRKRENQRLVHALKKILRR